MGLKNTAECLGYQQVNVAGVPVRVVVVES
jgi:hypothetical protein